MKSHEEFCIALYIARSMYSDYMENLAKEVRENLVQPFCSKYHVRFVADANNLWVDERRAGGQIQLLTADQYYAELWDIMDLCGKELLDGIRLATLIGTVEP